MILRRAAALLFAAALALGAGCGTEPDSKPQPPAGLQPPNDTPQNTILRFIAAYEGKKTAEYRALFTGDFKFSFSNAADPTLANKWITGWSAADESISAHNLFQGGTNLDGIYQQPATSIDLIFSRTSPVGDVGAPDTTKYKVLETFVDAVVVVPPEPPATDALRYVVTNNFHRIFLVRGDAANGLRADQPADSTHWYIWKWNDETAGTPGAPGTASEATADATWGGLKAAYR
jgi:hypothetical protein